MSYLHWYLSIGAAVTAVLCGGYMLEKKSDESKYFLEMLDELDPDRKKLSHRIAAVVFPAILCVAIWPVAIFTLAILFLGDVINPELKKYFLRIFNSFLSPARTVGRFFRARLLAINTRAGVPQSELKVSAEVEQRKFSVFALPLARAFVYQ